MAEPSSQLPPFSDVYYIDLSIVGFILQLGQVNPRSFSNVESVTVISSKCSAHHKHLSLSIA